MEPLKDVESSPGTAFNPGRSGLAPLAAGAAVAALRSTLQAELRGESRAGSLHGVIRALCADAKRQGVRAEQLLVVLKDVWHSLPDVRRLPVSGDRDRLLAHTVTMCIEEYYDAEDA